MLEAARTVRPRAIRARRPRPDAQSKETAMAPRDLSAGMLGADVQAIQQALNLQPNLPGPPLQVNGVYDAATAARVIAYQTLKKLPQTGVVDAATRLALYPYGVATITIFGARLALPDLAAPAVSSRIPNFSTYQLTPPSWAAPRLGTSWEPLPIMSG